MDHEGLLNDGGGYCNCNITQMFHDTHFETH